jgi:hypothetical protein
MQRLSLVCAAMVENLLKLCCGSGAMSRRQRGLFTAKEHDSESGLDNFGARYCASTMGRFMTVDHTRLSAFIDDPQT